MSADELNREVNRLYWKTTEPVTRLAAQLEISRGTFYNHLQPLPADATCSACGGRLHFRTRSSRDSGDAHCGDCGADERLASATGSASAPRSGAGSPSAATSRSTSASRAASSARSAPAARKPRAGQKSDRDAAPGLTDTAARLASRAAAALPGRLEQEERRTQLLVLAVSTAVLGLGILYYSRHRS